MKVLRVQGNFFKDLREKSAKETIAIDFDGYAIGGLSVGESKDVFADILSYTTPLLPENKPRYLMGVGTPEDIFTGVSAGIDMFDCVLPTRLARHGHAFTKYGKINLRNAKYKEDLSPVEEGCDCENHERERSSYRSALFVLQIPEAVKRMKN